MSSLRHDTSLFISGLLLGIGMGGFIDGILFHQIFQIHSMLSNIIPPNTVINIEVNMFWDGLFHVFTWLMTALGIIFLWRAKNTDINGAGSYFMGFILIGFGLFNIVEGIIDHLVLQLHHVLQRVPEFLQWGSDLIFLILSGIFVIFGIMLVKKSKLPML